MLFFLSEHFKPFSCIIEYYHLKMWKKIIDKIYWYDKNDTETLTRKKSKCDTKGQAIWKYLNNQNLKV